MSYTAPRSPRHWHAIGTHTTFYGASISPTGAGTYPTADLAIYVPVPVQQRVVVRGLYICNSTAVSGNFDVGLYDAAGTRLASSGTTAQSGTTTEQVVDITDTTIGPGLYYIAVVLDNTTGSLLRDNDAAPLHAAYGLLTEQLGAGGTLPATATWAVPQTLTYLPNIGMLIETTVA